MRIALVTQEDELHRLLAFRYRVYVEELGWLPQAQDGPPPPEVRVFDGQELLTDDFEAVACNYAAYDDEGRVVGSVRVVPDGPLGLPLEKCRPLDGYRSGKRLIEICRLAVCPEQRCTRLAPLLMKAAYQCAVGRKATHIVLDTYVDREQRTHNLYYRMGFETLCEPYPDPNYEWTLPVVPLALDLEAAEREWPTARPRLYHFFKSPHPPIDHGAEP